MSEKLGFELIFAGALFFEASQRADTFDYFANHLLCGVDAKSPLLEDGFSLAPVLKSWPDELFFGAIEFYGKRPEFMQVIPRHEFFTNDVPLMNEPWSSKKFPAWKWLRQRWGYSISPKSMVLTDTDILGGHESAVIACRFSNDYWEIFSRHPEDIDNQYKKMAPMATLLSWDKSLRRATQMHIGEIIQRRPRQLRWFSAGC